MGIKAQLYLLSLGRKQLLRFKQEYTSKRFPPELSCWAAFGDVDLVIIDQSNQHHEGTALLKKLDLHAGLKDSPDGGWSKVYTCSIDIASKYKNTTPRPLQTLCLLEHPGNRPPRGLGDPDLKASTGGFYDGIFLYPNFFKENLTADLAKLRQQGCQTFTIPIAGLDYVLKGTAYNGTASSAISLAANATPGKELQAVNSLYRVLEKTATTPPLTVTKDHFHLTHGNYDIILTKKCEIEPIRFLQEMWKVRESSEQEYLLDAHSIVHHPHNGFLQADASRNQTKNHDKDDKRFPATPFSVQYCLHGYDWRARYQEIESIRKEKEKPLKEDFNYKVSIHLTPGDDKPRIWLKDVAPNEKPHAVIVLSHATLQDESLGFNDKPSWLNIAEHEVQLVLASLWVQNGLLAQNFKGIEGLPDPKELRNKICLDFGEIVSTAASIGQAAMSYQSASHEKKVALIKDYIKAVWKHDLTLSYQYTFRVLTAVFMLETLYNEEKPAHHFPVTYLCYLKEAIELTEKAFQESSRPFLSFKTNKLSTMHIAREAFFPACWKILKGLPAPDRYRYSSIVFFHAWRYAFIALDQILHPSRKGVKDFIKSIKRNASSPPEPVLLQACCIENKSFQRVLNEHTDSAYNTQVKDLPKYLKDATYQYVTFGNWVNRDLESLKSGPQIHLKKEDSDSVAREYLALLGDLKAKHFPENGRKPTETNTILQTSAIEMLTDSSKTTLYGYKYLPAFETHLKNQPPLSLDEQLLNYVFQRQDECIPSTPENYRQHELMRHLILEIQCANFLAEQAKTSHQESPRAISISIEPSYLFPRTPPITAENANLWVNGHRWHSWYTKSLTKALLTFIKNAKHHNATPFLEIKNSHLPPLSPASDHWRAFLSFFDNLNEHAEQIGLNIGFVLDGFLGKGGDLSFATFILKNLPPQSPIMVNFDAQAVWTFLNSEQLFSTLHGSTFPKFWEQAFLAMLEMGANFLSTRSQQGFIVFDGIDGSPTWEANNNAAKLHQTSHRKYFKQALYKAARGNDSHQILLRRAPTQPPYKN